MSRETKRRHTYNAVASPEMQRLRAREDRVAFTGVTFRNFPLPAKINRLQTFVDNYLNFPDDTAVEPNKCYFKAASSNVTMSILNYGKMSTESENLGWIAQHEVLFSVPVEWYKVNDAGELVFHDWAYVAPFIFVDNDRSLSVGREVYGWTKVKGWMEAKKSTWTSDPREPRNVLSMATELIPTLYTEDPEDARSLIDVVQEPPMSFLRGQFSTNDPFNPWWSASRISRQYLSAMNDAFESASGLPIFGNAGTRRFKTGMEMSSRLAKNMLAGMPWIKPGLDTLEAAQQRSRLNPSSPYMNNLTLKQFRDAQEPDFACYQALVNSKMSIDRLSDGGFLGGSSIMAGDITGGYRIHLHQYEEQPIIETLGIDVAETQHDEHGVPVAVLSPVMPTWMACDLRYDMGTTLCWRTKESRWFTENEEKPKKPQDLSKRSDGKKNRFNTTRGAALRASVGPFHYPDTIMRFFPFSADRNKLQQLCDDIFRELGLDASISDEFAKLIDQYDRDTGTIGFGDQLKPGFGSEPDKYKGVGPGRLSELNHYAKALADKPKKRKTEETSGKKTITESDPEDSVQSVSGVTNIQHIPEDMALNYFQPCGDKIYMMLRSYGDEHGHMYSEQNNLGVTANRELLFLVPIIWSSWDDNAKEVRRRLVFITPYYFCDSMRHALSESEVNGRSAIHCTLEGDDDWWFRAAEDNENTTKIRATLKTLLMPALDLGQPAEFMKLVEIIASSKGNGDGAKNPDPNPNPEYDDDSAKGSDLESGPKDIGDGNKNPNPGASAFRNLFSTTVSKKQNDAVNDVLTFNKGTTCIDLLALKQYRATGKIENHCYQSIVLVRSRIEEIWERPALIPDTINVRVESLPTMPIVEQLGINHEHVDSRDNSVGKILQPKKPWSSRAAIKEEVGINLYTRVYDGDWARATKIIERESPIEQFV